MYTHDKFAARTEMMHMMVLALVRTHPDREVLRKVYDLFVDRIRLPHEDAATMMQDDISPEVAKVREFMNSEIELYRTLLDAAND